MPAEEIPKLEPFQIGVKPLDPPPSDAEIRKLQRRIDLRVIPWICIAYMFMRIDFANVASVAIMNLEQGHGIKQQLNLSPQQWNWVVSCFFYTYISLEPVSTMLMKHTTPSFWLGRIMIVWGIIVCCIASVNSYGALIACRVLLGAAEAGFTPCIIYYLAFWFRAEDLPIRIAIFTSFGQLSAFVGPFLTFAVSFVDGDGGLAGWRWLFIIEGIPPVLLGIMTLFIMPDYPQTASFLSDREKAIIISRLSEHAPSSLSKTWDTQQVLRMLANPLFWIFSAIWAFHAVGSGTSSVISTIIYQLGFTTTAFSNVLVMPLSLATFISLNTLAWLVQKKGWNPFFVAIGLELVHIVCNILLLTIRNPIVRYLTIVVSSAAGGSLNGVLWPSRIQAARGTTAAGVAIGITNALNNLSGLVGPHLFSTVYGPTYRIPFEICLGLLATCILFITAAGILMGRLGKDSVLQSSLRTM